VLPQPIDRFTTVGRDSVLAAIALAITLDASSALAVEARLVASGLSQPLFVGAPTGDTRLFIVQKGGQILVRQPDGTTSTFLDIGSTGANLINTSGERGLLGLAFDPNFAQAGAAGFGTFYVDYVDRSSSNNTVVARYQVSASNPNVADPGSRQTVISVLQPSGLDNHKAGWIGFRPGEPDNLYIATGDGGSGDDPQNRAQNLNDDLGKMLRINVRGDDFAADANRNYSIPSTNPFVGQAGNDEIWAYGLRNPYRDSFDRQTGDLWIGDVGQNSREEVDFARANAAGGANYGWRVREGTIANPAYSDPTPAGAVDPIYDYTHGSGAFQGIAVIGGYVYRGPVSELQGQYFFGDYVSGGRIWSLKLDPVTGKVIPGSLTDWTATLLRGTRIGQISSFGEDAFGNLYVVDLGGTVYTLVPEPATWMLTVAGLGLLLLAARRRAVRSAPARGQACEPDPQLFRAMLSRLSPAACRGWRP